MKEIVLPPPASSLSSSSSLESWVKMNGQPKAIFSNGMMLWQCAVCDRHGPNNIHTTVRMWFDGVHRETDSAVPLGGGGRECEAFVSKQNHGRRRR